MDMTKDIMDFEQKLDTEQYEPNDYTMVNIEIPKQQEPQTDMAYETAKTDEVDEDTPPVDQLPAGEAEATAAGEDCALSN